MIYVFLLSISKQWFNKLNSDQMCVRHYYAWLLYTNHRYYWSFIHVYAYLFKYVFRTLSSKKMESNSYKDHWKFTESSLFYELDYSLYDNYFNNNLFHLFSNCPIGAVKYRILILSLKYVLWFAKARPYHLF